jgi:hypothetical protein
MEGQRPQPKDHPDAARLLDAFLARQVGDAEVEQANRRSYRGVNEIGISS